LHHLNRVFNIHLIVLKISTKNTDDFCLSRNPRRVALHVSGNTLSQFEKFKYLRVVFTNVRTNKEIDAQTGKANAFLREIYLSVITKQEICSTTKLSVFETVFVPIITYGHESWVMTKRVLT